MSVALIAYREATADHAHTNTNVGAILNHGQRAPDGLLTSTVG